MQFRKKSPRPRRRHICFAPNSGHSGQGWECLKLTRSGSRRFVLTNLKCKSEIRIVAQDLPIFEGREVRSGEALSFLRNIG